MPLKNCVICATLVALNIDDIESALSSPGGLFSLIASGGVLEIYT